MFRMLTTLALMLGILPLIGTGCSQSDNTAHSAYSVTLEASPSTKETRQAVIENQSTTMGALLHEVGLEADTAPREEAVRITKLNGVISTLKKEWHLYINNTIQTFTHLDQVPVHASDTIEWKYEETNSR